MKMASTTQMRYILFSSFSILIWIIFVLYTHRLSYSFNNKLTSYSDKLFEYVDKSEYRTMQDIGEIHNRLKNIENSLLSLEGKNDGHTDKDKKRQLSSNRKLVIQSRISKPEMINSLSPVLIMACNRKEVNKIIDQILEFRKNATQFPLFVSQDCGDQETENAIVSYGNKLTYLKHINKTEIHVQQQHSHLTGYYKIARHYKWAIGQVFLANPSYQNIIILEDDMLISEDFLDYFRELLPILHSDPTIWCISAWNDNGAEWLVKDNTAMYRTDFMPGLGWMLTRKLWAELSRIWPLAFWDDWMRGNEIRKNRVCISPEISRTKLHIKQGVSGGLFFEKFYQHWVLNSDRVDFSKLDLSYLIKPSYDEMYYREIRNAKLVTVDDLFSDILKPEITEVRIVYTDYNSFKHIASRFRIMEDERGGVLRTAYNGVVTFWHRNRKIHLMPKDLNF